MFDIIQNEKTAQLEKISDDISQAFENFLSIQPINNEITHAFHDLIQNHTIIKYHQFKNDPIGKNYRAVFDQLDSLKNQLSSVSNSPEKYQYLTRYIEVINQRIVGATEAMNESDKLIADSEKKQDALAQRGALSLLSGDKLPDNSETTKNIAIKESAEQNKQAASFSKSLLMLQKRFYTEPLEHLLSSALREEYESQLLAFRETVLPQFIEKFQKLRSAASATIKIEHNAANEMLVKTTGKAPTHKEIYSIEEELNKIESDRMQTLGFIDDVKRQLSIPSTNE